MKGRHGVLFLLCRAANYPDICWKMRVLIIGCGYAGVPLGKELASRGHEVYGLRRSPTAESELRAASIIPLYGDITEPESLTALPRNFDWVVNMVASGRGGVEEYRRTYLEGTRSVVDWLSGSGVRKFVYTSSTSVYGQTDGSVVDEQSPTDPPSATSLVLVATEELLMEAAKTGFPAIVLRVAGIYGPGRGHLFQRFLKGEASLVGKGERILNMIHLEDLMGIIIEALEKDLAPGIYNAVDDAPVSEREFFEWLAERTGMDMPPEAPVEQARERKRGLTSKRVSNARLKDLLGHQFRYPTWREGYEAELDRVIGKIKQAPRAG